MLPLRFALLLQHAEKCARPRASVVLAAHNHERFVERAFDSVLQQTFAIPAED